jgi:hypothetical protein
MDRNGRGRGRVGILGVGLRAADHEYEPRPLHADQDVGVEVTGGAAELVDVEHLRRGADEDAHFAVTVPAERGDPAGQLVVVLARQDRVHHEGLEAGIPQSARLRGARVHVGRGEGDLPGVEQDRLAKDVIAVLHPLLDDLHGDADELQGLRERDRSKELPGRRAEHVGGDPRNRLRVVEPGDEARDAVLRDETDRRASPRRHIAVPGERLVEPLERGRGQLARGSSSARRASAPSSWAPRRASSPRQPIRSCPPSRRAGGTSRSPGPAATGRPRRDARATGGREPRSTGRRS